MLSFVAEELVELSVAGRTGAANAMTPNKQGAAAALGTLSLASTALPLAATATLITPTAHAVCVSTLHCISVSTYPSRIDP
jgi:hypothetical protein